MKIKMILPSLTEALSPYFRPIKYSLFPPLGLATLAGYIDNSIDIEIQDEHVERLNLDDNPEIVVIQVYITNAYRAYKIADLYRRKGSYVVLGGLHVSSLPEEARLHANSIFIGPGEDTWPEFLQDYKSGAQKPVYFSKRRTLDNLPKARRDLIKKNFYLVPNTIVVSRGCPHSCDFCYKESFFKGGKSFYTRKIDNILEEINSLTGRHLFFLDDNLFGNIEFAKNFFDSMNGMNRVWQAAGTISAVLNKELFNKAVKAGLKSLFIGFETLNNDNLINYNKNQNVNHNYNEAVKLIHDNGIMINGSFVFGMDNDNETVFDKTVDWAIENGIETATFHILTPYPGTRLNKKLVKEKRLITNNWDLYDTRHVVYKPKNISKEKLQEGYWQAYKKFYKWNSIIKSALKNEKLKNKIKHLVYSGGWKKFELLWGFIIKIKGVNKMVPILERILN